MKKILLSLALACFGFAVNTNAQVILSEDFEASAMPALPTGWTQMSTGTPNAWYTATSAGTTWGSLTGAYNLPAHTKYVVVDDAAYPNQLHDTLKSPVFDLTGYSSVWLNYDFFFYSAVNTTSGLAEHCYILGSSNGGTTWSVIDSVAGNGWNGSSWSTGHTNLSTLSGSNCRVAYYYTDGGGAILGVGIDNIKIVNLTAKSAAINNIDYNSKTNGISTNGEPVSFTISNTGITITSLDVYYTINGAGMVTQNFPGLSILPYTSQTFTFTTAIAGATAGTNTLRVGVPMVNGAANAEPVDTVRTSAFTKASSEVQRQGLIEEFSSSTCNPCKAFNQSYDPLCLTLNADVTGSNFNIIKFQMNWPSPGTDRSYNNDGNTRKSYYGVNGIPEHFVNGVSSTLGWSYPFTTTDNTNYTNEASGSAAKKSFIDMTVSYFVDTTKKTLGTIVTVTPHFTKTAAYHVYVALMDKHYQNTTNTTGQLDYYHVMRVMLPSATGHAVTSFTDGVAQTFVDSGVTYTNGDWTTGSTTYPTQMSAKFWSSPLSGEMVAYVEEDATKSVMQSILGIPTAVGSPISHVSVSTLSKVDAIKLYPNPATNETQLSFNLYEAGNVQVTVIDVAGRVVSEVTNKEMAAGTNKVTISTANIPAGEYIVLINTKGGSNADRLSVIK